MLFVKNKEYIGFNFTYWSLLYEGIFYLIAPFVSKRIDYYFWISLGIYALGILLPHKPGGTISRFIFDFNIYFALGQFLYLNIAKSRVKLTTRKMPKLL